VRQITAYESERLDMMLESWVRSKQGSAVGSIAMSAVFDDGIQGRSENYECRSPVLQADAEMIDELVDGRPSTQLRPAIPRMPEIWREPLRWVYLEQKTQWQTARLLGCAQQTVSYRIKGARLWLADGVFKKRHLAETRASA
jgi:DNA-directed RNA polymerase specialized sigma24 family protein